MLAAFLGALLVGAGGAVAWLASDPPVGYVRDRLISEIEAKTGRTLTIAGPVSLTVWPTPTLVLSAVSLSGPQPGTPALVAAEEIAVSLKVMPLLVGQVALDGLALKKPVVNVAIDAAGRSNAEFGAAAATTAGATAAVRAGSADAAGLPEEAKDFAGNASNPTTPSPTRRTRFDKLAALALGDVMIDGGTLTFVDARSGAALTARGLDLRLQMDSLGGPIETSGQIETGGTRFDVALKLSSLRALLEDRPARVGLTLAGAPADIRFEGVVTTRDGVEVDGEIATKAPSLAALAAFAKRALPAAAPSGPVALNGRIKSSGSQVTLTLAPLTVEGTTATGVLKLDTGAGVPKLFADLKLDALDIDRLLALAHGQGPGKAVAGAAGDGQAVASAAADGQVPAAPTAPTNQAAPVARPFPDVEAHITTARARWREVKTGPASLTAKAEQGSLTVTFEDVALYGGRGKGTLALSGTASEPDISVAIVIDHADATPLLKDAAGIDGLSGTARIALEAAAAGPQAELVRIAKGKAEVALANGTITGYDAAAIVKSLSQGRIPTLERSPTERTEFGELAGTFTFADGVATNQNLKFTSPAVRATGSGQVAYLAKSLDYTLRPNVITGDAAMRAALGKIDVPVRIQGPWGKPRLSADLAAIARDPKTIEAAKEVGRKLKENGKLKKIGDAIDGYLKKNEAASAGSQPASGGSKAKQLIDKLLKNKPAQPAQ